MSNGNYYDNFFHGTQAMISKFNKVLVLHAHLFQTVLLNDSDI